GMRYFNVFGPRQNPEGAYAAVIPKFINKLKNGEQPEIYGDGTQSRDFTYIENVIDANLKACKADSKYAGNAYNIACGDQISLLEMYDIISKDLNVDIEPKFIGERRGDIKHSNASIEMAKKELNYTVYHTFY